MDRSPAEVVATLLDEEVYLCSERTMYRVLASEVPVQERRAQRTHPEYKKPELMATAPNQGVAGSSRASAKLSIGPYVLRETSGGGRRPPELNPGGAVVRRINSHKVCECWGFSGLPHAQLQSRTVVRQIDRAL